MTWSVWRSSATITRQSRMISGRVPMIVMTFSLDTRHLSGVCIRPVRIEHLARLEQHDHHRSGLLDNPLSGERPLDDIELPQLFRHLAHRQQFGVVAGVVVAL